MISIRNYIIEEWMNTIKGTWSGKTYEIFKNPSKSEYLDIIKESEYNSARGILDKRGSIYLWDATAADHNTTVKKCGIRNSIVNFIIETHHGFTGVLVDPSTTTFNYYKGSKEEAINLLKKNKNLSRILGPRTDFKGSV